MFTLAGYAFRVARGGAVRLGLAVLAASVLAVLLTFLTGQVVGGVPEVVSADSGGTSILAFVGLVVALGVVFVLWTLAPTVVQAMTVGTVGRVTGDVAVRLAEPMLAPRTISHLEEPPVQDQFALAKGKSGFAVAAGVARLPNLVQSRLTALGSVVMACVLFSWWPTVLLLPSILLMQWHAGRQVAREWESWTGQTESQRRSDYLLEVGLHDAAKEIRVFGLSGWLVGRHDEGWRRGMVRLWAARRRGALSALSVSLVHIAVVVVCVVAVLAEAGRGGLSLSDVAVVIPALLAAGWAANNGDTGMVQRGRRAYSALAGLGPTIERYGSHATRLDVVEPAPASSEPTPVTAAGVRLEGVSFRYPRSAAWVLRDVDLELPAQGSVALVGLNGAGKSTIVKLIAGVYQPTLGRVTVDGRDLRQLDLSAWQASLALVPQEFLRIPMSVASNVSLTLCPGQERGELLESVAERVGIGPLVDELPDGWRTVLARTYEAGVDLSGGQWQRLALARSVYAVENGARLLLLDEPAAALDAVAEAELIERYVGLTAGVTSLVISHRFSVVRGADRIYVLESGRIREQGSHADLLAAKGTYARMFGLQASRFAGVSPSVVGPHGQEA